VKLVPIRVKFAPKDEASSPLEVKLCRDKSVFLGVYRGGMKTLWSNFAHIGVNL
jgi:hypothetical protein